MDSREFLEEAIRLAVANVADQGGPFGAVIVKEDQVVATGANRVTRDNDPTAHAEIIAIRRACQALGTFGLQGCILYVSCEPCPMCAGAALWARVQEIVFAADQEDAARGGFDDSHFWRLIRSGYDHWDIPVRVDRVSGYQEPFNAWAESGSRVDY